MKFSSFARLSIVCASSASAFVGETTNKNVIGRSSSTAIFSEMPAMKSALFRNAHKKTSALRTFPTVAKQSTKNARAEAVKTEQEDIKEQIEAVKETMELVAEAKRENELEANPLFTQPNGSDVKDFVTLTHPTTGASATVQRKGGIITSFKDGQGIEYISKVKDTDKFRKGEIETQSGVPSDIDWKVKSITGTSVQLQYESPESDISYVFSVSLEENELSLNMKLENEGLDAIETEATLQSHFYDQDLDKLLFLEGAEKAWLSRTMRG